MSSGKDSDRQHVIINRGRGRGGECNDPVLKKSGDPSRSAPVAGKRHISSRKDNSLRKKDRRAASKEEA